MGTSEKKHATVAHVSGVAACSGIDTAVSGSDHSSGLDMPTPHSRLALLSGYPMYGSFVQVSTNTRHCLGAEQTHKGPMANQSQAMAAGMQDSIRRAEHRPCIGKREAYLQARSARTARMQALRVDLGKAETELCEAQDGHAEANDFGDQELAAEFAAAASRLQVCHMLAASAIVS